MTWEQTIEHIRTIPEYNDLVKEAYFDADLKLNVERFSNEDEFTETLKYIKRYAPAGKKILDIGCGNGISCISFARTGYEVTAVEPDPSKTIGAGAIRNLKKHYELDNIEVIEAYAEDISFESESFDIVYIRQAMHHANNLQKFISECSRVLKKGGLLITIRDHVIFGQKDKDWFLKTHPLHKYYGGENAYTAKEYENAMTVSNLHVELKLKYYDSVINYFPTTKEQLAKRENNALICLKENLKNKLGLFASLPPILSLYKMKMNFPNYLKDESTVPGRMYSYIAIKK
jgi:ubiquinone/menaquinone biosynthesis C-methylase UbiE